MGCDIHMWVEARNGANEPWRMVRPSWQCSWCEGSGKGRDNAPCYWCHGSKTESNFHIRNYDLFAMLANVRNGRGFAGVKTGNGYVPISEPRGWPQDMSGELRAHLNAAENDDDDSSYYEKTRGSAPGQSLEWPGEHSESWLTLAEIEAYFESPHESSIHSGYIALAHLDVFIKKGRPEEWCGGVGGQNVRVYDGVQEAIAAREAGEVSAELYNYVRVQWPGTYRDDAGATFIKHFLPACRLMAKSASDVRLVFNFDS